MPYAREPVKRAFLRARHIAKRGLLRDAECAGYDHGFLGMCPSGQWEQTVNLSVNAFAGSNPAVPTSFPHNRLRSSSVEHFIGNEEVMGSIPIGGSISCPLQLLSIASQHPLG